LQEGKGEGGVHPEWFAREIEGEFVTLYKELIDDEVKFYGYFRVNRGCFSCEQGMFFV
jgi:hypothetical protein